MSIIQSLREYVQDCPLIDSLLDNIHVDLTEENPTNYGISPTGESTMKEYLDGSKVKQYNASLFIRDYTVGDYERLQNSEFLESFTSWLDEQNLNRNFPVVSENIEIESISCSNGMLFDLDETGDTGLYQLQLQLIYTWRKE